MQPYYEAKSRGKLRLGNIDIPSLVTQIADGENGGVMMNEFPRDFPRPWQEMRDSNQGIVGFNGTEYLELITAAGVKESDFPVCQGVQQHKIWGRLDVDNLNRSVVENTIRGINCYRWSISHRWCVLDK